MKKKTIILFSCLLAYLVSQHVEAGDTVAYPSHYKACIDLVYKTIDGWDGRMDLYYPTDTNEPVPVVINIHGGGWNHGSKEQQGGFNLYFKQGYAVANVEYRLTPQATAPAAVEDVRCAMLYLMHHAKTYHIDPNKVILQGGSAGGHLALVAGYTGNDHRFDRDCPSFQNNIKVMAIIDKYGPSDMNGFMYYSSLVKWLGKHADNPTFVQSVSPVALVNAQSPPTYIIHGDADPTVPYEQSVLLQKALQKAGVKHQFTTVPGGLHGNFPREYNQQMEKEIVAFISDVLKEFQGKPLIWNQESLNKARTLTSEAAKKVMQEADKELSTTIRTVVDKEMTPPSGDKHDYMSLGRYWWPNPGTPDGLPYVRKDGVVNPEFEKFDRNALGQMVRSIVTLSLAFYLTDDETYAKKAVGNLRAWFKDKDTRMNPNLNFGQTIPGRYNGKGRGPGLIDTYSFIEMLDGVELLKHSANFTPDDQKRLEDWFETFLNWMLTSEIGQDECNAKNNHGTAYDIQVVRYALFVGKGKLAREILEEFQSRRIFSQIEPDGSQPLELARTKAFGYSVFNLTHYLDMCCFARRFDVDLFQAESSDGRSIPKAINFLISWLGKPIGDFPYKQIRDWEKVQEDFCWVLYRAESFTTNSEYRPYYAPYLKSDSNDKKNILF